jgi:hypothetical protein
MVFFLVSACADVVSKIADTAEGIQNTGTALNELFTSGQIQNFSYPGDSNFYPLCRGIVAVIFIIIILIIFCCIFIPLVYCGCIKCGSGKKYKSTA